MDYLKLLEHSYDCQFAMFERSNEARLTFLSEGVFGFTLYDSHKDEFFARRAIEVCAAITEEKTYNYISMADENYTWFLVMCNMPFFSERIEWGSSIRGAWWGSLHNRQIEFSSDVLWVDGEQFNETLEFSVEEWKHFIAALIEFAQGNNQSN